MIRLVLRRNRVRLVVWWLVIAGLFAYVGSYYKTLFPTQASLDQFATLSNTPAIKALTGLAAAPDTLGGAVWTKAWMTAALSLAFGVAFLVTRSGRADEELGRTELLRSRVLGLHSYSVASWVVNAALCVAAGGGVALASAAGGLDPAGTGVTGSLVLGASVMGLGLVAIGVAAIAGQVASTSRGANALASIVLGGFYALRMVGDLGDGRLTWASPVGWGQEMQPFAGDRWWPLALSFALAAILLAVAARLELRRDLGAGLTPERPGPAGAPARYGTPLGLGLRLQRGPIIGWTIALVFTSLLFGSIIEAMSKVLDAPNSPFSRVAGGTGIDALLSLLIVMMALITTVFALQSTVGLRADEASGIIEPQLSGVVSRRRWALGRLLIPAVGSIALLGLGGAGIGLGYGAYIGDPSQTGKFALYALAYWPATMVFVGLATALFGWIPRLAIPLTWGVLAAMWFIVVLGDALNLPAWVLGALPFSATPYQPLEPLTWTPLVMLSLVACGLGWAGLARFSRRDIQPG
jgi:ABC-2 type transport system permease protein